METETQIKESAIARGIKAVGVGKRGSKSLGADLAQEILAELKAGNVNPFAKGAFFGGLFIKGITQEESILKSAFVNDEALTDPKKLINEIAPDASEFVKEICIHLLQGKTLDVESAHRLGKFLFSNDPGDCARGLVASVLRVRYETPDEYDGLFRSMQETLEKPFREKAPSGDPIIQLAEPFDGVDNSYLITPLLADYIQSLGYRVVTITGRNSGPKKGNTVLDLIKEMKIAPISENSELGNPKPDFGWYINQENLSRAVDRWVDIRRQTIKRPFLSTLEKFMNPADAQVIITSAFHPPYTEKMITVAERAGFPAAIVMRNGQEGSLAFALNRPVKVLCSAQQCEGEYKRHELELNPSELLGFEIKMDEKLTQPSIAENARLIRAYKEKGSSGNSSFDSRVKISRLGLQQAIEWVAKNIGEKSCG